MPRDARTLLPMKGNESTETDTAMNEWPDTASDVQAAQGKLSRQLYTNLSKAEVELERRSNILQRSHHGPAYAAAFDQYMGAVDARDNAVKALRQNFFHVSD